ncbi:hypothetical protein GUJ93_ZPchr0002g25073 [Zizania palustris]|uniref:Uncharacterized protein n=1 Tax=Zizania palustris TaxID=103762 RepID=A0A8J5S3V6_ZIZPA|nr:hypothetical protein GUJ93_ZPchr0002g25073 [Zizania palustris]
MTAAKEGSPVAAGAPDLALGPPNPASRGGGAAEGRAAAAHEAENVRDRSGLWVVPKRLERGRSRVPLLCGKKKGDEEAEERGEKIR